MDADPVATARRRARIWGGLVLGTIAVATVAVLIAIVLWVAAPSYWNDALRARAEGSPAEHAAIAQRFESHANAALTSLPRSREDMTRELVLPMAEVNAWLGARMRPWLESQGVTLPPEIGPVVLAAEDGRLVLAFRVQTPQIDQVFSVVFDVQIQGEHRGVMKLIAIRGGRLPLPLGLALRELPPDVRQNVPPKFMAVIEQAQTGIVFDPAFRIDSMRNIRVLNLEITDQAIRATVRQERR